MRTLLWLLAFIASVTDATPLKVMSAPNMVRVGTAEYVFVECQDCGGHAPMNLRISAWSYPTKAVQLTSTTVSLNSANNYQALGEIMIPVDSFHNNPKVKQYVYLQAAFPTHTLEKTVLVSFQSGYLFIQTDKTLYTPHNTVNFRIFALTPDLKPMERDEATGNAATIEIKVVSPEGIVFSLDSVSLRSSMYAGSYRLSDFASLGQWKIVSWFPSHPQQSYSAEFEVNRYVLPSYEVKITSDSPFYYYDTQSFNVMVKAMYLFGKEVDGRAYVEFGVIKDSHRKVFPSSMQRIPIIAGQGQATLQKDHIINTFPNVRELVGGSLFVTATVFTENGREMVKGALRNIPIVSSPYVINFDKTPKFFKPGMPFFVTVTVTNMDGSPAGGVPVIIEPGPYRAITQVNGRANLMVNTRTTDARLIITVRTNDDRLPTDIQTSASMLAVPYQTQSQSYIQINVLTSDVKVGTDFRVLLHLINQPIQAEITYLIMSRGQLVEFGRQTISGELIMILNIAVTKRMLPSFRLIVYYHPTSTEVVSDSVWVNVDEACTGTLKLEPLKPLPYYEPNHMLTLRITGDPRAIVGLVAVDKGVYVLNNKHLLTQKKVWEIVERADTGCTPGGGQNSMGVFFDAGLVFQSDMGGGTTQFRQEARCPSSARSKRSTSEGEDDFIDSSEITPRTAFRESGQWVTFDMPPCAGNTKCEVSKYDMSLPLRDPITTLVFTAISLSEQNGICVGNPLDVNIFQKFSIDLRLPYSAVVGEEIEIRAILYNYLDESITVRTELIENADVCSLATKRGRYLQQVNIGPSTTYSVPFVILPMKEGVSRIEVKASVKDSFISDGVLKYLYAVPNGVLTKVTKVVALDPKGGTQEETINNVIPRSEMVPNTPSSAQVFVTGKEPVDPDSNLDVELKIPSRSIPYLYRFTQDNYNTTRTTKLFKPNESVQVAAKGTGQGTLTLITHYYAVPKEIVSDCTQFNLSADFYLVKVDENEGDIYELRLEFFFKNSVEDASMTLLEITLPTGFIPINQDLDALSASLQISHWEILDGSEKGSIIVYLNKVAHDRVEKLNFRMRQIHKVANIQPASVSIYEYYDEKKCVHYYHSQRTQSQILSFCSGVQKR